MNLLAAQFRALISCQTVIDALAASGLPPDRLELEITESILVAEKPRKRLKPCISCGRSACGSRWMISAPAIRP